MIETIRQWVACPFYYSAIFIGFLRQDIIGRYKGTMAGLLWIILSPLATMFSFAFVFSVVLKMRLNLDEVGTDSFVIYLLSGLLPWLMFSQALQNAPQVLIEKSNIITKVKFPIQVLPYVSGAVFFVTNGVGLGLFMLYLIFNGYVGLSWLGLIPLLLAFYLFVVGLIAIISATAVYFRDLAQIVTVVVSLWFYMTPILYPLSMVPEKYQGVMQINPAYFFIHSFRQILLNNSVPYLVFSIFIIMSLVIYFLGGIYFNKVKAGFGDIL